MSFGKKPKKKEKQAGEKEIRSVHSEEGGRDRERKQHEGSGLKGQFTHL